MRTSSVNLLVYRRLELSRQFGSYQLEPFFFSFIHDLTCRTLSAVSQNQSPEASKIFLRMTREICRKYIMEFYGRCVADQ